MTCPNCATETIGPYCHQCGQKTENFRYTIKAICKDFFYSVVDLEKGLPHTILVLIMKPGRAIRDVVHGKRSMLYSPFKYLLLIGAVVILFSLRYNFFSNEYTRAHSGDMTSLSEWFVPRGYNNFVENFFRFAEDKATLLNIVSIPVFSLLSFTFLSKQKYNFAENLVLNTFITAQQLFFLLILIPAYELAPDHKTIIIGLYTLVVLVYNIWAYVQFFGSSFVNIAKATAVVTIGYLSQFPLNFFLFFCYENYLQYYVERMHFA